MAGAEASRDSSLGQLLRDARERRGLTLLQVSSDTKIPLRHLEALERDDLGALPPGPYLRGQIRACAKAVHFDPDLALTRLDRLLEPVRDVVAQTPPPAPALAPRRRRLGPASAALIVCGALGAIWLWRQLPAPVGREPVATTPAPRPAQDHSPSGVTGTTLPTTTPVEPSQAAPSPTATSDAQLVVTTEPPGARVTINGIAWGTSPATIRHLTPGDKSVRVSLDGYLTAERSVALQEGQEGTVSIRLRPAP